MEKPSEVRLIFGRMLVDHLLLGTVRLILVQEVAVELAEREDEMASVRRVRETLLGGYTLIPKESVERVPFEGASPALDDVENRLQ